MSSGFDASLAPQPHPLKCWAERWKENLTDLAGGTAWNCSSELSSERKLRYLVISINLPLVKPHFFYEQSKQRVNLEQTFSVGDGLAGAQASARNRAQDSERGLCPQSDPHKAVFLQETALGMEVIPDFTLTLGQMSRWSTCWKQLLSVRETNRGCAKSVREGDISNIVRLGNKLMVLTDVINI